MKRTLMLSALVAIGWLGMVATSEAQVFIRAPFVRVGVGDGVYVRAPFVNLYVPSNGPVYGPRVIYVPPTAVAPTSPAPSEILPAPQVVPKIDPNAPPAPLQQPAAQTFDAFVKNFQPKAGSF